MDHRRPNQSSAEGARGRLEARQSGAQARRARVGALQLEREVWRDGRLRGEAAEAARRRERPTEEAARRGDAGHGGAAGAAVKKMVSPPSSATPSRIYRLRWASRS